MRWWRRRKREEDLDRELRAHLGPRGRRATGFGPHRPLKPATPPSAPSATQHWSRRRHAPCGDGHRSKHFGKTFGMLCESAANAGIRAVVVISLALGVGLNSSVFSVLNALLLRPLPSPEPDRLVRIFQHSYGNTSYLNYRDLQANSATLESLAAFSWPNPVALAIPTGKGTLQTEQAWSAAVSSNYFDVLGVRPATGADISPRGRSRRPARHRWS